MIHHFQDRKYISSDGGTNDHHDKVLFIQETPEGIGINGLTRKYHFEKRCDIQHDKERGQRKETTTGYLTINIVCVGWILDCISNFQILSTTESKYTDEFRC